MQANERQVGGAHYGPGGDRQHWDIALMMSPLYCPIQIMRYLSRQKEPEQDRAKAEHYFDKWQEHREEFSLYVMEWLDAQEIYNTDLRHCLMYCATGDYVSARAYFQKYLTSQQPTNETPAETPNQEWADSWGEGSRTFDTGEPQAQGYVRQDPDPEPVRREWNKFLEWALFFSPELNEKYGDALNDNDMFTYFDRRPFAERITLLAQLANIAIELIIKSDTHEANPPDNSPTEVMNRFRTHLRRLNPRAEDTRGTPTVSEGSRPPDNPHTGDIWHETFPGDTRWTWRWNGKHWVGSS